MNFCSWRKKEFNLSFFLTNCLGKFLKGKIVVIILIWGQALRLKAKKTPRYKEKKEKAFFLY